MVLTFLLAILVAWSPIALPTQLDRPPKTPIIEEGICPFEGCVFREWTANESVAIHSRRDASSPIAFRLNRGDKVQAMTGVLVTSKVGRVEFRAPFALSSSVTVRPGETLFLIHPDPEGFATVWFRGETYTQVNAVQFWNAICEDRPERCSGKIVERPESEWWVQVRSKSGVVGWTREAQKFNGKDAFGAQAID